jgi:multicomponent Na+:H+ antiporter subunit F
MFLNYAFIALIILAIASGIVIIRGDTIWDRLLGLSLFSTKIIILIVLYSLIQKKSYIMDIAIAYSLLGFIGIILIARFIQNKGGR